MKHYELNRKFFKRFEQIFNQLKKNNPEYLSIKVEYMARNNCFLVTLLGDDDLLKKCNDDLYKIPQMFENLKSV